MKEPRLERGYVVIDTDGKFKFYFLKSAAEKHLKEEEKKYENTKKQLIFWLEQQLEVEAS